MLPELREDYSLGKLKDLIQYGASPRASISLAMASKAYAFIKRRGLCHPGRCEGGML